MKNIGMFITSSIVLLTVVQQTAGLSSLIKITENKRLLSQVIKIQLAHGLMGCAHQCVLTREPTPACGSFNYHEITTDTGECELNGKAQQLQSQMDDSLTAVEGWMHGQIKSTETTFVFTTLGATGREGPGDTSAYDDTSLTGSVQLDRGIQIWTVPESGNYIIKALGASGGNGTNLTLPRMWTLGGRGASIEGDFYLNRENKLKILVGQQGHSQMQFQQHPGSGGGGTFVTLIDNTPLVIAGGGGGGASPGVGSEDGDPGQVTENGTVGGGWGGSGGKRIHETQGGLVNGAAGGGFVGNGDGDVFMSEGGLSFKNGGKGGKNIPASGEAGSGGFGGGGASNADPGGGGGYSGGGVSKGNNLTKAGGGGSYNAGRMQVNKAGVNKGDGMVIVRLAG